MFERSLTLNTGVKLKTKTILRMLVMVGVLGQVGCSMDTFTPDTTQI